MKIIKIGVLGPSNIAFRRTIPAIKKSVVFQYIGIAYASQEEWTQLSRETYNAKNELNKCLKIKEQFEGAIFSSFEELLSNSAIDAVYIPLPPSLHKTWAIKAIKHGKHVLLEKPLALSSKDCADIINLAQRNKIVVHENYAFLYHAQIKKIEQIIKEKEIGELRLIRASFSFPFRGEDDFRYKKELGGGAMNDCAGYPLKLACRLMNNDYELVDSQLFYSDKYNVDMYGSASLKNGSVIAQIFWGMDNAYRCNVELFGTKGFCSTERVYSPTAEMKTVMNYNVMGENYTCEIDPDDQFLNSLDFFGECILNHRNEDYESIIKEALLIEKIVEKGGRR